MKVKADFVTNSSSASFIMVLQSDGCTDIADVKEILERLGSNMTYMSGGLQAYLEKLDVDQADDDPTCYVMTGWTSMYNDVYDIPEFMRYLILLEKVDQLQYSGLTIKSFEIDHD